MYFGTCWVAQKAKLGGLSQVAGEMSDVQWTVLTAFVGFLHCWTLCGYGNTLRSIGVTAAHVHKTRTLWSRVAVLSVFKSSGSPQGSIEPSLCWGFYRVLWSSKSRRNLQVCTSGWFATFIISWDAVSSVFTSFGSPQGSIEPSLCWGFYRVLWPSKSCRNLQVCTYKSVFTSLAGSPPSSFRGGPLR